MTSPRTDLSVLAAGLADRLPGTHFAFGDHKEHGFVASFTAALPTHIAHWYLEREQFEPVTGEPGLYRLSKPEHDGVRRTRQAVHDPRRHGYTV